MEICVGILWGGGKGFQRRVVDGALRKAQGKHWRVRWALQGKIVPGGDVMGRAFRVKKLR